MDISIIIPAYNEQNNIAPLYEKIKEAMQDLNYELIFVNDGSTDNTLNEIKKIENQRVKIINFDKNKGQGFALYTSLIESRGDIIATIDADLQIDPKDIILMLREIKHGYDFVCGWRQNRKDALSKQLLTKTGNLLQNLFLGITLHDSNCPLKIFKRHCLSKVKYFQNYHRFISALIYLQGYKIKEHPLLHYPRLHGVSKYRIKNLLWPNVKTFLMVKFNYKKLLQEK